MLLGLLINEKEKLEMEYVIKRELEEILFDLGDERITNVLKEAMIKRFGTLYSLLQRIAGEKEWKHYILELNNYKKI